MKAIVVEEPGPPENLLYKDVLDPVAEDGWLTIRIRAFGLNRAELFTRQGDSGPAVQFPRIIGIECVGEVIADPSGTYAPGRKVATLMGGLGRAFDGSYAEQTRVPLANVVPIDTKLSWAEFGAVPEMFQTANGSLKYALRVQPGKTLLIRGGTSSVGLAALALAKSLGLTVLATTRQAERRRFLKDQGADHVLVDSGKILSAVHYLYPGGVDYVLDLVGTRTLNESLAMLADGGIVCMTGILAGEWELNQWNPMAHIGAGRYLTAYSGDGISREDLQDIVDRVESGSIRLNLDRTFAFGELVEAHRYMEDNRATGKLVVLLD